MRRLATISILIICVLAFFAFYDFRRAEDSSAGLNAIPPSIPHAPTVLHLERWTDMPAPQDDGPRLKAELEKRLLESVTLKNFNVRIDMRQSAVFVDGLFGTEEDREELQKILKEVGIDSYEINSSVLKREQKTEQTASPGVDPLTVTQAEVDAALENLPLTLSQARAVPFFKDGESVGVRLFAVRQGSIFERLDLQNGDIVTKIDGKAVSDPSQALKFFDALRSKESIDVELIRSEQTIARVYKKISHKN